MHFDLTTIWIVLATVSTIASAYIALVPAPTTEPWIAVHRFIQILALAIANAEPSSPPVVSEPVAVVGGMANTVSVSTTFI